MTKKITDLDPALPLTGAEVLPLVQNVVTRRSPLSALADWVLKTYQGFLPAGAGAVARTVAGKLGEVVSVKDFGAVGDGVTDDTAAIQAAHAASNQVHYPHGVYRINWAESTALVTYTSQDSISITGDGAKLYDTRTYTADAISAVFQFTTCTNVVIDGLNYEGQPIADKSNATTGIGYRGATFVNLSTGCQNVTVNADLKYLRYGVRAGDYTLFNLGYNKNTTCNLSTFECGYPVAFYLSTGVDLTLYSEGSHRTAYLAGVRQGKVRAYFKNQYIAPSHVLMTDSTTNGQAYPTGTSRGCADLDIVAHDMGSTIWVDNSFCAAISMSRGDAGTTFENIKVDVSVTSTDTVASTLSAFAIYNNFTPYQPSYPNDWETSFFFRNIKLTGTLDRSVQTVAENSGNGEIYYFLSDNTRHGTATGLDISRFKYYPGSGAKTRGFYYFIPGLVGTSSIDNCDFGTTTPFLLATNATSLVSVKSTKIRGSYSATSDSPYLSAAGFTDCVIASQEFQPTINKTFTNTNIQGAGMLVRQSITELTLSGATTTWTNSLPNNSIILGVSGHVTEVITGATGYLAGVATDADRYCNTNTLTVGSSFTCANSAADQVGPLYQKGTDSIVFTAKTSNFTGGKIRVSVNFLLLTAPTS